MHFFFFGCCVHVCIYSPVKRSTLPNCSQSNFFLRNGLSMNLGLIYDVRLAGQQAPDIFLFLPFLNLNSGIYSCAEALYVLLYLPGP